VSEDGLQVNIEFLDTGGLSCTVDPSLLMPIRGLRGEVFRSGKTVYHNDFLNSEWVRFIPNGHVSIKNVLFTPLMNEGKVNGFFGFANKPGGFTEDDARLAPAFSDLAAVALNNSQMVNEVKRLNEFRKRVLESINDAILVIDVKDFTIVAANKALLEQVKMSEEEVVGKPCYLVTHDRSEPCCPPNDICPIQEMIKTGRTVVVEHIHYDKEGNPFHVEVSANPIKNEKGNIVQVVHVSRDVSERYKVMEMKDRFMSVATHELRTPLISIKGYVDYVLTGKLGTVAENVTSSLEVVKRNTDRLLKLTDDLLDIQRITSEKLRLDLKPMDLREVIDHSIREAQPFLEEKKLRFSLEVPEGTLPVSGDDVRLSQVVMNLLINASKFTPEGGNITLHVEMDEGFIKVEVSDSGIGIRKEDLERVFQAFADVKKPTYIKGTGLGLSVTKGLVEAHGGSIYAQSEGEGKGSTFTFTLPKLKAKEAI
jgi:PAS domain S-box-containing protein